MTLSAKDGPLFYKWWLPFLDYVNGKYFVSSEYRILMLSSAYIVKTASSEAYLERLYRRAGSGDCELHY